MNYKYSVKYVNSKAEKSAERQARKCLKAGAAHPLLKAAGHEKCWKCGSELQEPTIGQYADFINIASTFYSKPALDNLRANTPFTAVVHPRVLSDLLGVKETIKFFRYDEQSD